jgi:hypothetical protein
MVSLDVLESLRHLGPVFRSSEAVAIGVSWRDLHALRDSGSIIELSRGLFQLADQNRASSCAAVRGWHGSLRAPRRCAWGPISDALQAVQGTTYPCRRAHSRGPASGMKLRARSTSVVTVATLGPCASNSYVTHPPSKT